MFKYMLDKKVKPIKIGGSLFMVIPCTIREFYEIDVNSTLFIISKKNGFEVKKQKVKK